MTWGFSFSNISKTSSGLEKLLKGIPSLAKDFSKTQRID
jgi:hypothetical protein